MWDREEATNDLMELEEVPPPCRAGAGALVAGAPPVPASALSPDHLIERLAPRVQHAVDLLVRGRNSERRDLVQACLVEILASAKCHRGGSLEAWAAKITYRVSMRYLKRQRRRDRTVLLDPLAEPPGHGQTPEKRLAESRLIERLARHLEAIPLERRLTLVFKVVHGHSVAEVAELTGVPLNTARDRIRVALHELRTSLQRDPIFQQELEEKHHERA